MFKKELTEAFKKFGESSIIYIGIPFALILDKIIIKFGWSFRDIFDVVFVVASYIYSVYAGLTIFQAEKKDRALEYFLSLPIPRLKVFAIKLLSRFSFLLLYIIILWIFMDTQTYLFTVKYLVVLFLASVFLSLVIDSILIGIIGAFLLFQLSSISERVIFFLINKSNPENPIAYSLTMSTLLAVLILLIPLGVSFWMVFKKMDLKPIKLQIYPYYYIALPAILAIILFMTLNFRSYLNWIQNR